MGAFADLALEQGVRRLVLLSGRGEEEAERAERAVQESGADVTVVRCAWLMEKFNESFLLEPILGGEVMLPASDQQVEPFIDADDVADVAVAALTDDRHIGEVYELTSPRLMTFPGAVAEIAVAAGREIRDVPVSVEEYAAGAAELGVPPEFVGFLTYLFSDVLGRARLPDRRRPSVLWGVRPMTSRDYARDAAAGGVWRPRRLKEWPDDRRLRPSPPPSCWRPADPAATRRSASPRLRVAGCGRSRTVARKPRRT